MSDRAAGNAFFSKGQYEEAIAIYEKLSSDPAALSNAAEACLQLRRFEQAEAFARQALELDETNSKSRSRLGRALAWQRKAVLAHLVVSVIADEAERGAAHQRIVECGDEPHTLYLGKVVVRGNAEGNSENFGLFASGDMLPGELALRERRICRFGRGDVIQEDERAKEVLDFLDSSEGQHLDDAIEGIFPRGRGAVAAMKDRVTELSVGTERSQSDIWAAAHVFSVIFFSSFEFGLFSVASLFNHSCSPNCDIVILDEEKGVLEWRTNRPVLKGQELTFSYLPLDSLCLPVQLRKQLFAKNWGGFDCACSRCQKESQDGPDKEVTSKVFKKAGEPPCPQ